MMEIRLYPSLLEQIGFYQLAYRTKIFGDTTKQQRAFNLVGRIL